MTPVYSHTLSQKDSTSVVDHSQSASVSGKLSSFLFSSHLRNFVIAASFICCCSGSHNLDPSSMFCISFLPHFPTLVILYVTGTYNIPLYVRFDTRPVRYRYQRAGYASRTGHITWIIPFIRLSICVTSQRDTSISSCISRVK